MNESEIFSIERPHPKLLKLYVIRSILSGPAIFFTLPLLLFRYHTLHYKFDVEGISMSWGLLFRSQVFLNYARIQDIHIQSGVIQRWLGLADIQIQTAAGSADAEMIIEGLVQYEDIRDYLYTRMRGYRKTSVPAARQADTALPSSVLQAGTQTAPASGSELEMLSQIAAELAAIRQKLESSNKA